MTRHYEIPPNPEDHAEHLAELNEWIKKEIARQDKERKQRLRSIARSIADEVLMDLGYEYVYESKESVTLGEKDIREILGLIRSARVVLADD